MKQSHTQVAPQSQDMKTTKGSCKIVSIKVTREFLAEYALADRLHGLIIRQLTQSQIIGDAYDSVDNAHDDIGKAYDSAGNAYVDIDNACCSIDNASYNIPDNTNRIHFDTNGSGI